MKTKQINFRVSEEEYNLLVKGILQESIKQNRIISLSEGILTIVKNYIRKKESINEEHPIESN